MYDSEQKGVHNSAVQYAVLKSNCRALIVGVGIETQIRSPEFTR